ncbi:MAG: cellulase family glycosylhydrolase, partial [Pricia sp.]
GNSLFWSNAGDTSDFYNEETVEHLTSDWNSSIIRAAMGVKETWDGGNGYIDNPDFQEAKIRKVVDAAINQGIYVIIDWHTHEAEKYTDEAVAFFTKMARIYGDTPNVIYEIYNEPINQSWPVIKNYAEQVIAGIRSEDPDNLIVVGTSVYSQEVDVASRNQIDDNNVAYTLHFYAAFRPHDQLRDRAQTALDNGAALFVTEWGTILNTGEGAPDPENTQIWMEFLQEKGISHANWSVSDKPFPETGSVVQGGKGVAGLKNNQLTTSGKLVKDIIQNWESTVDGGGGGGDDNVSPTVTISRPNGNRSVSEGYRLQVDATANDSDGNIVNVRLFIDDNVVRQENVAPYNWGHARSPKPNELNGLSPGSYTIKVVATDNDGATGQDSFRLTVTGDGGGGGSSDCTFGTPTASGLKSVSSSYKNVYVLGDGGPSMDNIREFTINWDAQYNGLYQFAFNTDNGKPQWYVDFSNSATFQFKNANPEIRLRNTGIPRLDGSYWATTDGNNFVMVSKGRGFTLYFSNSGTAPDCGSPAGTALKASFAEVPTDTFLYPNPANDELNFSGFPKPPTAIEIRDMQGRTVLRLSLEDGEKVLDIGSLAPGMHIAIINGDGFRETIKFSKL